MRLKDFSPELRVSLTVADGVLLACLSRDPLAVRHVLDVMEKQPWAPSVVTSGILRTAQGLRQDPASTDWGWFLWGAAFRRLPVVFELNQVEARELHGRLSTTAFLRTGNIVEDIDHLKKFLANTPDALLLVSLDALPSPWRSAPIVAETLSLMSTTGAAPRVWAALLGDDWSGRLRGPLERALTPFMKGLKVPTLLVGIETSNSLEMLHRIPVALDNLNRRFGWGVIARWVHLGPFQGLVFEDTRDSFYSQFLIEERVAALAIDGWLVLATNFGGLRRLVQSAPPPPETPASPRYAPLLTASAAGFFWADLSRATAALRGTMGMVSLALLTRQPEQTTAVRRRMAIVSAWLEGLSAFEEAALYAGGGTGTVQQITFVLGPNAAARLIKTFDSMGAPR